MLLYNINLIFIFICLIMSRYELMINKNKINSSILKGIAFFSLWIIPAMRYYTVGTDTEMYRNIFLRIENYTLYNSPVEVGYILLNKFISGINILGNSQIIFWATSFISLYLISVTIFKYSKAYDLSFFLFITMYFYYNSFNLTRQFIAISITFYAVKYIFSREFKKYAICIFIAFLFHQSAIIMLPFYYILQINISKKMSKRIIILGIIGYFIIDDLLNIIFSIIPRYSKYASGELSRLLAEGSHFIHAIMLVLLLIFVLMFKEKILNKSRLSNVYINALVFATFLQILGVKTVLFSRVVYYLSIYSILLIPEILNLIDIKKRGIVYLIVVAVYFTSSNVLLSLNQSGVLPYIVCDEFK